METLSTFVQDFLIPGSMSFLLLGLLFAVVLIHLGSCFFLWGLRLLLAMLVSYGLMSVPIISDVVGTGLDRGYGPIRSRAAAQGATAVVVLSGGSRTYRTETAEINSMSTATALRTLEAIRVNHLLDGPWVVVSGGIGDPRLTLTPESKPMADELVDAGIPEERILLEPASRNTYEHSVMLEPLLVEHSIERFILVTSQAHMWRAHATFRARGLHAIPSTAKNHSRRSGSLSELLVPSITTLGNTREYLREYLALLLYWGRGWLTPPEQVPRERSVSLP